MNTLDEVGLSFIVTTAVILTAFDISLAFTYSWIGASGRSDGEIAPTSERFFPKRNFNGWLIAWFMIISGALLALSSSTCVLWASKLRLLAACEVSNQWQTTIAMVLFLHGLLVSALTWRTGGAAISPYPSGLLLLPTLGIFLQVHRSQVLMLAAFSLLAYVLLHIIPRPSERVRNAGAAAFLNASCFVLSMLTAFASIQITQ